MASIHRSALLPYSSDKLYAMVQDVEAYPQFMDGCVGAQILDQGEEFMEARLDLARGGSAQSGGRRARRGRGGGAPAVGRALRPTCPTRPTPRLRGKSIGRPEMDIRYLLSCKTDER